jgi:hypothetical protein
VGGAPGLALQRDERRCHINLTGRDLQHLPGDNPPLAGHKDSINLYDPSSGQNINTWSQNKDYYWHKPRSNEVIGTDTYNSPGPVTSRSKSIDRSEVECRRNLG